MHWWLTRFQKSCVGVWKDPFRGYIYLLVWPWFIPATSFLLFGFEYISGWKAFIGTTVLMVGLCMVVNEVDTFLLHRIIRRYPDRRQSWQRLAWMILLFSGFNTILAEISLRIFDVVHFLKYSYASQTNSWVLILVLISSIIAAGLVESGYAYIHWRTNHLDKKNLEYENLRFRIDDLKSRINPHFLFNSLNSISSLISDDPARAECYVDELSKVYRYVLQANKNPLIALDQEISFIQSYVQLLHARYGRALEVSISINAADKTLELLPISLQIILDDIIQHHELSTNRPLRIQIQSEPTEQLSIRHNRQPRTVLIDRQLPGIETVALGYRIFTDQSISVDTNEEETIIRLPLFRL